MCNKRLTATQRAQFRRLEHQKISPAQFTAEAEKILAGESELEPLLLMDTLDLTYAHKKRTGVMAAIKKALASSELTAREIKELTGHPRANVYSAISDMYARGKLLRSGEPLKYVYRLPDL